MHFTFKGTTMLKRLLRTLCFPVLALTLALTGCAPSQQSAGHGSRSNLEPEITGLEALSQSRGRPLTAAEKQALDSHQELTFRLSPEETEEMRLFFQYFTRDKRDTVQRWMLRSEPHLEYVRAVMASHRLPQDLLALPYIESGYNVLAVSNSGAVGMWQFMPATARRFGLTVDWWLDERRDPYLATVAAARYLKALHQQFGDWQLALAAYNAGEGSISRAMASTGTQNFNSLAKSSSRLKDETKHYVPKFMAMLKIVRNAKRLGFNAPDLHASKELQEVRIPAGSDLSGLASNLGLSWEQFHALNPAYRRQVSPPDRTTAAWVPKNSAKSALAFLQNPPGQGGGSSRIAGPGDTWWNLSRQTNIPANVLREANGNKDAPAPGKPVLIPLAACSLDNGLPAPEPAPKYAKAGGTQGSGAVAAVPSYSSGPAPAPASGQPTLYVVRKGDTLESVAGKTGVGVQELISFNKANPKDALVPGTPLLIPVRGQASSPAPAAAPSPVASQAPASPASKDAGTTELDPNPKYKIIKRTGI
ncbi:transglycosylase SLT domain-containing protein [Fundidesulfovibrio agrisoli]|uniref:lytic transglycosylase domain-containing protein n=1 Tax=Fundidesulfovibrio agrisoli TaxID=2922717 RepID=UPI003C2F08A8